MRRLSVTLTTTALAVALLGPWGPAAPAAATGVAPQVSPAAGTPARVVAGCVNRKTGQLRVLARSKAKCRKGEKKIRWNRRGPAGAAGAPGGIGPAGPTGPLLTVKAADGTPIGVFVGMYPSEIPVFGVLVNDGLYYYLNDGTLFPFGSGTSANWTDNACAGTPYFRVGPSTSPFDVASALQGYTRFLYRSDGGTYRAWRVTPATTPIVVATQLYRLNSAGACVADGAPETDGTLYTLAEVTPPTVKYPGPLSVG